MNIPYYLTQHTLAIGNIDWNLVTKAGEKIWFEYQCGKKVIAAGNGGSASDAQHFVAELMGRFKQDRSPLAAICLNDNTSTITAIANDYSYDVVFSRQLEGIVDIGDVVLLLSTSGESKSILNAAEVAKQKRATIISITGKNPNNSLKLYSDIPIFIDTSETSIIQEMSIMIIHIICGIIDDNYFRNQESISSISNN